MRFHDLAEDVFGSQTSIRILRTWVDRPQRPFTGRALAAEAGTPPLRTLQCLRRLEAQGLARSTRAGRSLVWTLSAEHILLAPLQAWFAFERKVRDTLLDEIRASLAPMPFIRRVVLFGSLARQEEGPGSDIDVFVLVDHEGHKAAATEAVSRLDLRLRRTFTNPLRALIYDQREFGRKGRLGVVRNIVREGWTLVDKHPIKTENLDRAKAKIYARKADQFARLMDDAASRGDWNAVGLAAVHAVISAADALTTAKLGVRSRAVDHEEVVKLIRTLPSRDAAARADQALAVLGVKNQVEYEARDFEEAEAKATMKQVDRFLRWAREALRE